MDAPGRAGPRDHFRFFGRSILLEKYFAAPVYGYPVARVQNSASADGDQVAAGRTTRRSRFCSCGVMIRGEVNLGYMRPPFGRPIFALCAGESRRMNLKMNLLEIAYTRVLDCFSPRRVSLPVPRPMG